MDEEHHHDQDAGLAQGDPGGFDGLVGLAAGGEAGIHLLFAEARRWILCVAKERVRWIVLSVMRNWRHPSRSGSAIARSADFIAQVAEFARRISSRHEATGNRQ